MHGLAKPTSITSKKVEPRKSSRERKFTPKMLELKQQEASQRESKFILLYEQWKEQVRVTRAKLKNECCDQDLGNMMDAVEGLETKVRDVYENIRSQVAPSTEIRRKMDSCRAVTIDLMELMKVRMSEVGLEEFDTKAENTRLRMVLDREYAQSIFGTEISKSTVSSRHPSCSSEQSITAKRAECAAQFAAKKIEIEMEEAIATQRQELKRLEDQRDLQVIAAKLKAYSEADSGEACDESSSVRTDVINHPTVPYKEIKRDQTFNNNNNEQTNCTNNEASLVQVLRDTMVLTRLPAAEPSVFSGDPLKFLEWSASFKALIERRCTNSADRLFYLQKYISGEARSVLEGHFYRKDDEAYDQAWKTLNARYGHPFVIQCAFREKLKNWPKIGSRESVKLRQYSDFLIACSNAMPYIKGLQVLNDCEQNQKMLQRLPDWVTSRWNRHVTMQLRQTEEYPNFKAFAEFIAQEAEIACNPVTSFHALKSTEEKPARDIKRQKANAFITNVKASDKSSIVIKTCMCCGENHSIHKCQKFINKSVEDKRRFILDNNLCFGCLRRGHNSKDCKNKATCGICKKHHPTPLHEDRPVAADSSCHAMQAEENASSLSCCLDRSDGGSTSMIVPVWISSATSPEAETLAYALLDTQSSNTFVDREVCEKMGAGLEPVKLKLTTMMGKDSIVQSERVSGLRVRGFSSQSFINLPLAYTRDFIPLERSHIPTHETAKRWKHLNRIAQEIPELMDCEVGLLIGYDCSRALAPRQVITGGDDEPYAIKTDLGWSIVGSSPWVAKSTEVTGLCHRVSVKELPPVTPAAVIRALESDFRDTNPGDKSISQDDIQFMHLLNERIHQNADGHLEMPLPFKTRPRLPENKRLALVRLKHLKRKFEKNPKFKSDYFKFMEGVFKNVLGVKWNVSSDTFSFKVALDEKPATRRGILSTVASVFDPLGFLAPFLLLGKKVLQEMCQRGVGWDEPLPRELKPQWESWLSGLENLQKIQIPRCFSPENLGKVQRIELHHFSDASSRGYGQCSYIRMVSEDKVHCSFVMGKARVAPTKVVTIPRLELTAAVVSSAVSRMLKEELELKIDQEYFWTDSQVVLSYINNEARRFHVFVANRVQRIRETTDSAQWYYVDTNQNPADHASRGLNVTELISSNWFTGPKFLWEREISTPKSTLELLVGDPEVKTTQVLQTKVVKEDSFLERFKRFSNWHTALNVVVRIQQLAKGVKAEPINVENRRKASLVLIKLAQRDAFKEEMQILSHDKLPQNHQLSQLDPVLKDGVLRVGGRLKKASLPLELKHPVILPRDTVVTRLILDYCHQKTQHQGRGQTLNELRANGYWVVGGSKVVANRIKQCVTCRRARRPTETQKMADLPADRVNPSPPFSYCGMDCFGPFHTKQGRKECKRYGLIFTCLSSRAVHIEMLEDVTTDAFINALRCFIAIRGAVRQIRSDQGTNFVGAKNELTKTLKEVDKDRLTAYLAEKQCDFTMNVPDASHMGGVWERQIRTVRSVLSWVLSQSAGRLDDASLRTFFYEAMSIVNSRPLTTDNINDPKGLEPLTPNHLLTMKACVPLPPPGKFVAEDLYAKKRWRRVQYLTEQFWGRWRKEYLTNITLRQRWQSPRRNVKIGDIVIVKEEGIPRNDWRLGRVLDVCKDEDGLVRKATIQMGNRKLGKDRQRFINPTILERPIHKLVVIVENN
ncbi:hypothetical protein MHYP_G00108970 [Metynnis hypsauchen]